MQDPNPLPWGAQDRFQAHFVVQQTPNEIGKGDVEKGDYYSRCFTQTTRMITNKGSLKLSGANIDAVQIIQKG